jgi:mannose-1-phosphate guanylyltransferase
MRKSPEIARLGKYRRHGREAHPSQNRLRIHRDQREGAGIRVRRFTEKPNAEKAREFVDSGNYLWNSGMFIWGARSPMLSPNTFPRPRLSRETPPRSVHANPVQLYSKCENIRWIMPFRAAFCQGRPSTLLHPADFGWNDRALGGALRTLRQREALNVVRADKSYTLGFR